MSHYSVTVVLDGERAAELMGKGQTLDTLLAEALAPFDEDVVGPRRPNETYTWDEGELPFGPTGKDKRDGLYASDEVKAANTWQAVYDYLAEDYGAGMVEIDGEARRIVVFTTYNEQSKWDWYSVGGRWKNYFRDSETGRAADVVLVKNLDTDAMITDHLADRMALYDRIHQIVGEVEHVPWREHVKMMDEGRFPDIDATRKAYHAQQAVQKIRTEGQATRDSDLIFLEVDRYMVPREKFEKLTRNEAVPTYALLGKDGVWSEPGQMGWFGMSTETEATKDEFQGLYMDYLATLNPADLLVCVDCHI